MPKEYIYPRFDRLAETGSTPGPRLPNVLVKVGWDKRTGAVQIATINRSANDAGMYADLDRRSINDLILVLRKVRDQQFGSDA